MTLVEFLQNRSLLNFLFLEFDRKMFEVGFASHSMPAEYSENELEEEIQYSIGVANKFRMLTLSFSLLNLIDDGIDLGAREFGV
jgi:hypothetical protein